MSPSVATDRLLPGRLSIYTRFVTFSMHILIDPFKGCPEKVVGPECTMSETRQAGGIHSLVCTVKVVGHVKVSH
jgi:hypothetical protein